MTAKYFAILTNQGAARLANAAALGTKLNLTQMAVGDANGTLPTPDPAQTKLINQKRIAPLNLLTVDPDNTSQIIAEQIIPENEGGFWIREIGLYDDNGILIAVANCPETYKPQLQEGSGRTQTIRMILIVSSTSSITLKIDPSVVLATRKYVDDKVIEVKTYADDLMKKHVNADNPHTQYPLITNALKEMADAGLVAEVLKNLGLGGAAKMDAATLDITSNSLVAKIPVLFLGEQRALIIQASSLSSSSTSGTIVFPAAFPNACIVALTHDYSSAGTDLSNVKFNVPSQTSVNWYVQNMGSGSTSVPPSSWGWLAIGW
ncbi:TPA: phage tail protein [Citrobacter amalonaticus]|nr:phage tail protein [Citrobacter amalonaticus]